MSNMKWFSLFCVFEHALMNIIGHLDAHSFIANKSFMFFYMGRIQGDQSPILSHHEPIIMYTLSKA